MRFEGGARGVVTLSQVSAGRKNHLNWEIDGSQASAAWRAERPRSCGSATATAERAAAARPGLMRRTPARTRACPPDTEGFGETFRELYRAVYRAVEAGERRPSRTTRRSPTVTSRR